MTDRIEAYAAFARLMELGSFSAAGRQLGISQSTVSKHVAGLENSLGVQLFTRTTRRISPTPEASRIYEHVQHMLDSVETAHALVKGQQPEAAGLLRLALPESLGRTLLFPLVRSFMAAHPLISLDAVLSDNVKDIVAEGLELAITTAAPTEGSLITRTLRVFEWAVVASPAYLAAHGAPESAIDLEAHEIVRSTRNASGRLEFDSENGRQVVQLSGRLCTNSDEAAYQAAVAGDGIAIVPSWLIDDDVRDKKIRRLLPDYYLPPITVTVIYPQTRFLSRRARSFIDHIATAVASQPRDRAPVRRSFPSVARGTETNGGQADR
ncbi:LysR family transcriptional regulator [Sphingobium xenophagum]